MGQVPFECRRLGYVGPNDRSYGGLRKVSWNALWKNISSSLFHVTKISHAVLYRLALQFGKEEKEDNKYSSEERVSLCYFLSFHLWFFLQDILGKGRVCLQARAKTLKGTLKDQSTKIEEVKSFLASEKTGTDCTIFIDSKLFRTSRHSIQRQTRF